MNKYAFWLAGLGILTIIFGTIYTVSQQSLRQGANDPQVQLAQDTAAALSSGTPTDKAVSGRVDIAASLAPFIIIYDQSGKVVAGSGQLNGKIPTVPFGVLAAASLKPDNRVTWQPRGDVRIASVSVKAGDFFVLSGRNLREVEKHEDQALLLSTIGWLASLAVLGATFWLRRQSK